MKTTFSKPHPRRRVGVSELLQETFSEQELAVLRETPDFRRTFQVAEKIESFVAELDSKGG